jgi:hypothetical protein
MKIIYAKITPCDKPARQIILLLEKSSSRWGEHLSGTMALGGENGNL